jgi:hypothetical protein
MAIHILGNGPSLRLFDRNSYPNSDVFVGCNFSDVDLGPDYTVIVDAHAMKKFRGGTKKGYRLEIPAVVTQRAYDYIDKDSGGWQTMAPGLIDIVEVIPLERDRTIARNLAMNSGQHATIYSIRRYNDQNEVHLWGIDSFWSNDLESTTDAIVRPEQRGRRVRPSVTRQWNGYWHKIFTDYSNHDFVIHKPIETTIDDRFTKYPNVRITESCHTRNKSI